MTEDLKAGEWTYLCCETYIRGSSGLRVAFNRQCARCQTKNLRFIHVLEHKDGHQIHVGIECAGVLIRNFELPRLAENETKRKAEWREQKYKTPGRCFTTPEQLVERGKL